MQYYQLESIQPLQQHLAQNYLIYQRVEDAQGDLHWQHTENAELSPLNEQLPISSPKNFFFSERENLFTFDGTCFRETLPSPAPFVLLGVQSCDLTAIAYQDQFFTDDPYYQARRQQALLIGIDCLTPCEQGFCHTVDAGPGVAAECADIILHRRAKGDWLLIANNEKGENALTGLNLAPADSHALGERKDQIEHCKQQFDDRGYIAEGIDILCEQTVDNTFWQQVGIQCLSCSGCTNLCPTCSCYSTQDLNGDDGSTTQQRFWDSCLYESFQREASQHNPSHQAGERVKRFWTHKFSPHTESEFGRHGCVGCGRCEQTCPGVIGVHSLMKRLVSHQEAG